MTIELHKNKMEFQDKTFTCIACGSTSVWTAGEQQFIQDLKEKGKLDERMPDGSIRAGEIKPPKRCADCRKKRNAQKMSLS
jgi:hypothetical protein